ncbi:MAG: CocE/NonD family hydrolase, partial [Candidatus Dormibacteraeota bacterium]|nr:CocE/NonD family hydrolase [Candidatus Dormibacteraeota bacterium]
ELLTDLYLPQPLEPRPAVLIRTPYGRAAPWGLFARGFAERGYQVVLQSCRGTFGSGGEITFSAEAGDGRAAADWIVAQRWSNGEIGTFGPSYLSFVQWALASTQPPQLKAMAIQIMSADRSASYYPGGTFALDNALTWTYMMSTQEQGSMLARLRSQARSRRVLARAFLHLPLQEADVLATGHEVSYYRSWLENQPGDDFWRPLDFRPLLGEHRVPTSFVGGWYDYFLPYLLDEFHKLSEAGADTQLVVGPWAHSAGAGMLAGFREGLAWFDAHLQGQTERRDPARVRIEVMGGGGRRQLDGWPPPAAPLCWHLQPGGGLAETPSWASEPDRFRYDPADPTPAVGGTSLSSNSGPRDNRNLEARSDVLTYTTAPLEDDLEVVGPVFAELHTTSSTPHFDLFARLCDVDPGGRSVNVCDGIVRCGPGTAQPVRVDLWPTAYRFARGHRVRLQVSGGSHPRFARNLGSGEPLATGTRMEASDRAVYHDPGGPSCVTVACVRGSATGAAGRPA